MFFARGINVVLVQCPLSTTVMIQGSTDTRSGKKAAEYYNSQTGSEVDSLEETYKCKASSPILFWAIQYIIMVHSVIYNCTFPCVTFRHTLACSYVTNLEVHISVMRSEVPLQSISYLLCFFPCNLPLLSKYTLFPHSFHPLM